MTTPVDGTDREGCAANVASLTTGVLASTSTPVLYSPIIDFCQPRTGKGPPVRLSRLSVGSHAMVRAKKSATGMCVAWITFGLWLSGAPQRCGA
jgi:hypothetical protein